MAQIYDGSEYLKDVFNGKRPVYNKIPVDKSKLPEAEVRQKLAKNRNWLVCRSWMEPENKKFMYVCAVNAHETAMREISFDEACKDFHWKKFDIVGNEQSLKWQHDPAWDDEVTKIMERTKNGPVKIVKGKAVKIVVKKDKSEK